MQYWLRVVNPAFVDRNEPLFTMLYREGESLLSSCTPSQYTVPLWFMSSFTVTELTSEGTVNVVYSRSQSVVLVDSSVSANSAVPFHTCSFPPAAPVK